MRFKSIFYILFLLIFSLSANAGIFKCKQADGSVRYVERPCPKDSKSEKIKHLKQSNPASKSDLDAPIYPGAEVIIGEEMESATKGVYILNVTLQIRDEPKKIREFYSSQPEIKKCKKNDTNTNHMCSFAKYKNITGGDLFIDDDMKKGKVEVYMSYFYKK